MGLKGYNKKVINKDPKTFNRTQLRYIYRRIVNRIEKKPRGYFIFKKLRGSCGLYCWGEYIKIDPRRDLVPTIIHEVLHDLYPKNWEGWVSRIELKIINILTPYDIYRLLTIFFSKLDIKPHKRSIKRKKAK